MAKAAHSKKITKVVVRMYCMGTGDCFILKFLKDDGSLSYTMMIDCGVWTGAKDHLRPYMQDLVDYVKQDGVDLLVVTHEHTDHVSVFEACQDLFTDGSFKVKKAWMGWSENDDESKIKRWKTQYGEKKKSLAFAAQQLETAITDPKNKAAALSSQNGQKFLAAKQHFSNTLSEFSDLHTQSLMGVDGKVYKGPLEGMRIVKKIIAKDKIEYLFPGNIIEDIPELPGIRFNVLGPPEMWEEVKKEVGKEEGDTFAHNDVLRKSGAFSAAVVGNEAGNTLNATLPFDDMYEAGINTLRTEYEHVDYAWRTIDYDWLLSAGSMALRMNSFTNNLSLALAIEFVEDKRVLLFPGDAEFGSWESWHNINWGDLKGPDGRSHTEYLLNQTVFYKVAHHMSHHGTAEKLGVDMMKHKDLVAMATLDYEVIADKWPNTMPNRGLLQKLLSQTKGRLIIMNENNIFADFHKKVPVASRIKEAQKKMTAKEAAAYKRSFKKDPDNLYKEFTVEV